MAEALEKTPIDSRWGEYMMQFSTLPRYYFSSLEFPGSLAAAERTLRLLELEMNNISAQFIERETELNAKGVADDSTEWREYLAWRVKALRAQRMKENQVKIVQAWIANQNRTADTTVEKLQAEVKLLRECIEDLVCILHPHYPSDIGIVFDKIMPGSSSDRPEASLQESSV